MSDMDQFKEKIISVPRFALVVLGSTGIYAMLMLWLRPTSGLQDALFTFSVWGVVIFCLEKRLGHTFQRLVVSLIFRVYMGTGFLVFSLIVWSENWQAGVVMLVTGLINVGAAIVTMRVLFKAVNLLRVLGDQQLTRLDQATKDLLSKFTGKGEAN